jgi:hypothetical protein
MRRLCSGVALALFAAVPLVWAYGCKDSPVEPTPVQAQSVEEVAAPSQIGLAQDIKAASTSGKSVLPFWSTGGNANTGSFSEFVGTTDYQPLIFKTNGSEVMRANPDGSVELGHGGSQTVRLRPSGPHVFVDQQIPGSAAWMGLKNTSRTWFLFSDASPDYFTIFSGSQKALTILGSNGGVGIGTDNPQAKLHVVRNTPQQTEVIIEDDRVGAGVGLQIKTSARTWELQSRVDPDYLRILAGPGGPSRFAILGSNGNVGISTDNPIQRLHVNGNALADAHLTPSSRRWKENITPIEGALDKVLRLQGVSFDWTADGRHDLGLIAEEVGEVLPELVTYDGADASSLDYARLVAVLIEAVKEQQQQIKELRESIR